MTSGERIARLLAVLQWAARQSDGVAVDDLCDRFGLDRAELVKELELASMVGADALDYDEMPFDVLLDEGRVHVTLFSFDRPLRITPAEGLALVSAAHALVGPDADDSSPLWRALTKLGELLGIEPGTDVDVDLDPEGGETGRALAGAVAAGRRVRFRYWTYGRDVVATRDVDPWRVHAVDGSWYLWGRAAESGEERRFHLGRIADLVVLDEAAVPAPDTAEATPTMVADDAPRVVIDLPSHLRWVAEAYPVVASSPGPEGRLTVTLAVSGTRWLERLLLRLGPEARVVEIDPDLGPPDLLASAAARILGRYRS